MKKNYITNLSFFKKNLFEKPQNKALFFFFCFFFLNTTTILAQTTVPFTSSGTWTCPAGVTSIKVEAYGGGGGGGRGEGFSGDNGGGGGGGGAYTVINTVTVSPATNYNITIGNGGAGGTSIQDGIDGNNTTATFGGTTITANGGKGGKNYIAISGTNMAGGAGGTGGTNAGGNGFNGANNRSGGAGGSGGTTGIGSNGNNASGGAAGGGAAGKGGDGSGSNNTAGQTGSTYGGGGGGATGTANGGAGAEGYLIITYTSASVCTNTTQYPAAAITAPISNTPVTISSSQYQSEYSAINGIASGSTYILANSIGGYVTIHSGTYNGPVVASGSSPLTWAAASSGSFYVHWNTNASCGTASNGGITTMQCSSCGGSGTATNDECATAVTLTVSGTCAYTTGTTQGATTSSTTGTPAPGCASYSGNDVWFKTVVPGSGQLTIDTQAGGITDSGIALYSGSCGALTLISCDDDSSSNGAMSMITASGLIVGSTVYIRVWEYGGDTSGTFGICVTSPLCSSSAPAGLTATIVSSTAVTANWTAASPAPAAGYQYYLTTSSTAPTSGTTPTGSVGAGITTLNLTSLSAGTTYYLWVRSNCGGSDGSSSWTSVVFTMPICSAFGPGTGTTSLGCPEVVSGGLGLNGANPPAISCTASSCVNLEATFLPLGQTTSYSVQSITYAPPYQFDCLRNPVSVNVDDRWSPVINLPFNFCFYGNSYNTCLIGSNGIITFDTVGNTPGGTCGWSFNANSGTAANIPVSGHGALVENSIFGGFQDLDPADEGEVGWELITLNTGCRALVASWSNVPMYSSDAANMYTGMTVLYENTNVVEVYIQRKRITTYTDFDGDIWNDGNAVIGMQNATGTIATVAPSRNALDANWTSNNEAWRFTPSGASITSIAWYEGATATGPVLGTASTLAVCPAATTTYTAQVTYTLCGGATLKETDQTTVTLTGSKVWDGSSSNVWNDANNWTPVGVPTAADCVVIPDVVAPNNDAVVTGTGFNGLGLNLTVQPIGNLTIDSSNSLTITDKVTVNAGGVFTINDDASLIQTNNVANTGNIQYKRTANIRQQDYVYWSSPVAGFSSSAVSPGTSTAYIYKWSPTIGTNINGWGNWVNGNETMTIGKGYIARGPDAFSTVTPANYTATFTGVPNNGNISMSILRGSYDGANYASGVSGTPATKDDDNWNLIGNPYPSSVNAINFLTANTNINGWIKVWSHENLPSGGYIDPFYNNYVYNYTPADYITYNSSGASTGPGTFNGYIGSGQGFMVLMNHSAATPGNVSFTNTMRNSTYSNSQFFRNGSADSEMNIERNRIWLDLINTSNNRNIRTLVGYIEGATNDNDRLFDAKTDEKMSFNIFSKIDAEKLTIQGKALPFVDTDLVPLGIITPTAGEYSIAIGAIDGLFSNTSQEIYLEDLQLGIIHNLRGMPYSFSTPSGIVDNRFVLRYKDKTLSNNENNYSNEVNVFANNHVNITSTTTRIKNIVVYDVLGKTLIDLQNVQQNELTISQLKPTTNMILVKVTLENDAVIVKKVIY